MGVEEAAEEENGQMTTYIGWGTVIVVAIENGGEVADGTPVHPLRG